MISSGTQILTWVKRIAGELSHRLEDDVQIRLPGVEGETSIHSGPLRLPSGRLFPEMLLGRRGDTLIGINREFRELVKVELRTNPQKNLDIIAESHVMKVLAEKRCVSCPDVLEIGHLNADGAMESFINLGLGDPQKRIFQYMVQEYFPPGGHIRLADLIFSLLEQKALGVYQYDVKPPHLRVNPENGVCMLIDYDQARFLDQEVRGLNCSEFLRWCDELERKKNGSESWRVYFPSLKSVQIDPLMRSGALNLAATTVYKNQLTTNNSINVYHTIRERDVFVNGTRNLEDRREILDRISFKKGERVLDVGCNAGLLCHYLHDRGCAVTGMDMDLAIVTAAGMIARISGRQINFVHGDIDTDELPGEYDTIVLFSVLHHAKDIVGTAKKITQACNRILIEARLVESGKKPSNGKWTNASDWSYSSVDELLQGLCNLFDGFEVLCNHGIGGKGRYIVELGRRETGRRL